MIKHLKQENYKTSKWSGGTTTEIAIYPPTELYADRNFIYRISSATIDLEKSDFTELPNYNRFITPLDNTITLLQEREYTLSPLTIHYFSGSTPTTSIGKCTDFNLMINKDYTGSLETFTIKNELEIKDIKKTENIIIFSAFGTVNIGDIGFCEKESLLISDFEGSVVLESSDDASVLVSRVYCKSPFSLSRK